MSQVIAAIDLGSNAIKMKIVQMINNQPHCLEDFSVEKNIGEEVYLTHSIQLETIAEIIKVFDYFKGLMDEYSVSHYRAVATSAFRQAKNALNVVEIIRMHTEIEVEVIDDTIEKFLTYKSIRDKVENYQLIRRGAILIEANSGGSDISVYARNNLVNNHELDLGMKSLKYKLMSYEKKTAAYPALLKVYIRSHVEKIIASLKKRRIYSFLAVGGEMSKIKELFFPEDDYIPAANFLNLLEQVYLGSPDLKIHLEKNDVNWYEFVAHMILIDVFLNELNVEWISIPNITLRDGVLAEIMETLYDLKRYKSFNDDCIGLAKEISSKYNCDKNHVKAVHDCAVKIFDALYLHYNFDSRDRLLLQIASYLHEIGKFTRMKHHESATFDLIRNISLFGITIHERNTIAHVCHQMSESETIFLEEVPIEIRVRVNKLSAILAVADALDKSKKQEITIDRILVKTNSLVIQLKNESECLLERIYLEKAAHFFEHTYGIPIITKE